MWENFRRRSTVYLCQINVCYDDEFLFLVAVYDDGSERNPIYSLLYKHKSVLRRLQLSSKYMTLVSTYHDEYDFKTNILPETNRFEKLMI